MKNKVENFIPHTCPMCKQDTTYQLSLGKGAALMLLQIATYIRYKGVNAVHPRKEMEGTTLTSNQVGNLSVLRFHGLIAAVKDNPGNYLLTPKGAGFLKGEAVAKVAIVQKSIAGEGARNIGYHLPWELRTTIKDLLKDKDYWVGMDYVIEEGSIINKI